MRPHAPRLLAWLAAVIGAASSRARMRLLRHPSPAARLAAEHDALKEEVARLHAELELLRGRLENLPSHRRPHFKPWQRLDVLWHHRRYGLTLAQAARTFVLSRHTLSRWEAGLKRRRPRLLATKRPANRLADIVEDLVHRLRLEEAAWGSRRIAHTLARLGLQLSRSSVQRILRRPASRRGPRHAPTSAPPRSSRRGPLRANRPNHLWLVDLFDYAAPFRLRRVSVLSVLDLYSRLAVALVAFPSPPNAAQVRAVLRRAFLQFGAPGHVVTDHGPPFPARRLTRFLTKHRVRRRYGAVGRPQAVAAIDRWSQTIQNEFLTPWMLLLPVRSLQRHLDRFAQYATRHRPHQRLGGRSPAEVHRGRRRRGVVAPETVIGLERRAFEGDPRLPIYRLIRAA